MNTYSTPFIATLAARRSSADPSGPAVVPVTAPRVAEPAASAPFVPEWRRRAEERVRRSGYVAVLDTTSLR